MGGRPNSYRIALLRANERELVPKNPLISNTTSIGKSHSLLIRGEHYSGLTAFALELVKEYQDLGYNVLFFDTNDSLFLHRLKDLDLTRLAICKPSSVEEILGCLKELPSDTLVVLDSIFFFEERVISSIDWRRLKLSSLCARIRAMNPSIPLIMTDSRRGEVDRDTWNAVIEISRLKGIKNLSGEKGHTLKIKGNRGEENAYISYKTGRISRGYERAKALLKEGTSPTGTFEHRGVMIKGFWRFVHLQDDLEQDEQN